MVRDPLTSSCTPPVYTTPSNFWRHHSIKKQRDDPLTSAQKQQMAKNINIHSVASGSCVFCSEPCLMRLTFAMPAELFSVSSSPRAAGARWWRHNRSCCHDFDVSNFRTLNDAELDSIMSLLILCFWHWKVSLGFWSDVLRSFKDRLVVHKYPVIMFTTRTAHSHIYQILFVNLYM